MRDRRAALAGDTDLASILLKRYLAKADEMARLARQASELLVEIPTG
jgi:hypothetical protein